MRLPAAIVAFVCVTAHGQSPAPLTFEVASVKPAQPPTAGFSMGRPSPERFTQFAPLMGLIANAYQMQPWQLVNLPDWARASFFTINAKIPEGTPMGRVPPGEIPPVMLMLRSLLAERFQLKVHPEKREMTVYRIVYARQDKKLGPNITPSAVDCAALAAQQRATGQPPAPPPPPRPGESRPCSAMMGPAGIIANGQPVTTLTNMLRNQMRGPVTDETGLTGFYDFTLSWRPDQLPPRPPGSPETGPIQMGPFSIDPNGPSLMTALQEQLGLKLESSRDMVDVLVVDSVSQLVPDSARHAPERRLTVVVLLY